MDGLSLALIVALAAPPAPSDPEELREEVPPDRVRLENGREYEGRLMLAGPEVVVLRVGSRDRELERSEVAEIRAGVLWLPEGLHRRAELAPDDVAGRLELALRMEEAGLPLEARLLRQEVLLVDPACEPAHEALGHRRIGGRWKARIGVSWHPVEELDELHADFADARVLVSSHFDLRTNLPLAEALAICWSLERAYLEFHRLLGQELGLYHAAEPMEFHVHADPDSFPGVAGARSFFLPGDERAYVGWWGETWKTLFHETGHALLHESVETLGSSGVVPGWLDEGLAQYLAHGLDPEGRWIDQRGDRPAVAPDLFAAHAALEDGYGLKRVLNFQADDFHGSSRQWEKYAMAYTLVHYLLHGEDQRHRPAFRTFVVTALHEGKASSTHFKKALGVRRESELEEDWLAYVRRMAAR